MNGAFALLENATFEDAAVRQVNFIERARRKNR